MISDCLKRGINLIGLKTKTNFFRQLVLLLSSENHCSFILQLNSTLIQMTWERDHIMIATFSWYTQAWFTFFLCITVHRITTLSFASRDLSFMKSLFGGSPRATKIMKMITTKRSIWKRRNDITQQGGIATGVRRKVTKSSEEGGESTLLIKRKVMSIMIGPLSTQRTLDNSEWHSYNYYQI